MRAIRIYQSGDYQKGQRVELSPEAGQHVAIVLRMQPGNELILFCGDNREFKAIIDEVNKKKVIVRIDSILEKSRESPLIIHLAQAVSKGERMEWVMQKSTELGVASITPLITQRCVVKLDKERIEKKLHQWQAIVIAACEQSGRNSIPLVRPPITLEHYIKTVQAPLKLILHPDNNRSWRDYSIGSSEIALIIGPEGGLSPEEIALTYQHDFLPLSLGPRILRTETAAITALSVLQAVGGDL